VSDCITALRRSPPSRGVKLEDFQGQGKLDPALLKTLIVTDPAGAGDGAGTHNRIWIGKVEFRPAQ
jgi:hypothetical protein